MKENIKKVAVIKLSSQLLAEEKTLNYRLIVQNCQSDLLFIKYIILKCCEASKILMLHTFFQQV